MRGGPKIIRVPELTDPDLVLGGVLGDFQKGVIVYCSLLICAFSLTGF